MKIYKGDTGTAIVLDSGGEIVDTETIKLSMLKPGSSTAVVLPMSVFEGTKGRYISQIEDFDTIGIYQVQIVIDSSVGSWRGETNNFTVYDHFS